MITTLALLLAGSRAPTPVQAPLPTASSLFTKMFIKYAGAKTLTSQVHMTQTAMNKTVTFDSELAYERPDKIFFTQKKSGDGSYAPRLTSDGIQFIYTHVVKDTRTVILKESAHPEQGALNIGEMWSCLAGALVRGDDNFMLEAMVARPLTLPIIRDQLVSFTNKGKVQYGNQSVNDIEGKWRLTGFGQEGTFAMYISDAGDLLYQTTKMSYAVNGNWLRVHHLPANAFPDGVEVTTTWEANTTVDQPVDEKVFKLP